MAIPARHRLRLRKPAKNAGRGGRGPVREAGDMDFAELVRCGRGAGEAGLVHWGENHVRVIGETGETDLALWDGQRRLAGDLVTGQWMLILKGRQLGITTLLAAYTLWRMIFWPNFTAVVVNQKKEYAEDFIDRIRFMHQRLPDWCRPRLTTDHVFRLAMKGDGHRCEVRAMAGSKSAGRSITGDLLICDEAAFIEYFAVTLAAVHPAMEKRKGQIVCLSTSAGPQGDFAELWKGSYGIHGETLDDDGIGPGGFKPVFLHWSECPGRDGDWYGRQKALLDLIGPTEIKHEYPNTVQEAFEHPAGRVYPLFGEKHIGTVKLNRDFVRFRAIDWGETGSAYVVLFLAVLPDAPPGLLVSPECPNTIREMIGYRFEEDPPYRPAKISDHTPDALRYAVVTFNITGFVFVYREIYRLDSVAKGWNPMTEITEIQEQSGWLKVEPGEPGFWRPGEKAELFENTVYDRSMNKMGNLFTARGIPCIGNARFHRWSTEGKRETDKPLNERVEGIRCVSMLIDGTEQISERISITRDEKARRLLRGDTRGGLPATGSLSDTRKRLLARDYLRKRKKRS